MTSAGPVGNATIASTIAVNAAARIGADHRDGCFEHPGHARSRFAECSAARAAATRANSAKRQLHDTSQRARRRGFPAGDAPLPANAGKACLRRLRLSGHPGPERLRLRSSRGQAPGSSQRGAVPDRPVGGCPDTPTRAIAYALRLSSPSAGNSPISDRW
jgi:hypothetical protein